MPKNKMYYVYDTEGATELFDYKGCGDYPIFMPKKHKLALDSINAVTRKRGNPKTVKRALILLRTLDNALYVSIFRLHHPMPSTYTFVSLGYYEDTMRQAFHFLSKYNKGRGLEPEWVDPSCGLGWDTTPKVDTFHKFFPFAIG